MRTITLKAFILVALISQSGLAQWKYEILAGKPINYSQIKFFTDQEGYVMGEGNLCLTKDGGSTFRVINNNLPSGTIHFLNSSTGWIAGEAGKVWKTTDGGNSWNEKWANTVYDFFDITFVDSLIGWAVGNGGTIRKTTDGGDTWFSQTSGREPDWGNILRNVRFIDENVGIISTNNTNYLLKTTDGGSQWLPIQFDSNPIDVEGINILDLSNMFILDNNYSSHLIKKTTDGGISWTPIYWQNQINYLVVFTKDNFVLLHGDWQSSKVSITTDGGQNWLSSTGIPIATYFTSISFVNESKGFACGGKEILYSTNNGGKSWSKLHPVEETQVNLNSINFSDSCNGWIVGNDGLVFRTTDAGENWVRKNTGLSDIYDVQFLTPSLGWICGAGFVSKTTDGGNIFFNLLTEGIFYDVTYTDENNGFLIKTDGWNVAILKTTDKGTNWSTALETKESLWPQTKLFALNKEIIWAPLRKNLTVSRDGGANWEISANGTDVNGAYFFDEQQGFVTKSYYCLRTNDGGASWGEIPTVSIQKTPPHFSSELLGCFLTREGNIFVTSDGGFTWQLLTRIFKEVSDYNYWLNSVFFNSENTAWIVGDLGTIIKITYENPTKIKEPIVSMKPDVFVIHQNYPNPFNPSTKIKYSIPQQSFVALKVYDLLSREVATLVNEEKPTGIYEIEFDGSNLSSGVYFYQLHVSASQNKDGKANDPESSSGQGFVETKKMILMR